jgi:hypothetical protein
MGLLATDIIEKCGRAIPAPSKKLHSTLATIFRRDRHPATVPTSATPS